MRRRSLLTFIILNVLISLGVAIGAYTLLTRNEPPPTTGQIVVTVPILVTSTTDPNATPVVRIITATPLPGSAVLPTGLFANTSVAETPGVPITLDAQALNPVTPEGAAGVAQVLPENCILHVVASGDTPFGIAEQYGADGFRVMEVNGLNDETASLLQIGDELIVPLEGCPLTGPATATPEPTETPSPAPTTPGPTTTPSPTVSPTPRETATPTLRPTLTLPPTASSARVQISAVNNPGQVTTEQVTIINTGNNVNLRGWTLSDAQGEAYTFSERLFFSNALITIASRVGQDTSVILFMNRTAAMFESGDVVTLRDAEGVVQSSFRVP